MEEIKNNQTDEVIEQRPSTKYGRTAYQEQLRQEQLLKQQQGSNEQSYNNNTFSQENVFEESHAYHTLYTQHQTYSTYQEPKAEVKNNFAYILMALVAASAVVNYMVSMMTMEEFNQLGVMDINAVIEFLLSSSKFTILSYIADLIFWVSVVFFSLDIMAIYKAGKKITGAILFAIFLRPAYFIWRAYLLGQKKVIPIIYIVCYYAFCLIEYITIFVMAFEFAANIVQ